MRPIESSDKPCSRRNRQAQLEVCWLTLSDPGSVTEVIESSGVKSGRLLSIVLLLQSRGKTSASEIATHLGVSLRTIYRDLDVLSGIGVPLYADTGRLGGYRLVDGYRTTLTGLTSQEALTLFLIGLPAPAASLGLAEGARSAEAKLLAALPAGLRDQASRLRHRFFLDLPPWYDNTDTPAALAALAEAVLGDRQIRIRYRRWAEPREARRLLHPYALVIKNGTWYLVAATGAAHPRTYRVSNILELTITDQTFTRSPGFDLPTFWRTHLTEFDRRRVTGTAVLRIAPALIERLPDVADAALQVAAAQGHLDDTGWTLAELPIESPSWAATRLIGHGSDIEVLEPVELRHELTVLAQSVVDRYRPRNR